MLDGGNGAQNDTQHKGKDNGPDAHVKGDHEGFSDDGGDGTVVLQGKTQIAVQAIAEIHKVLHPNRLVQAVLGVKCVHSGLGQLFVTDKGVAGQQTLHEEGQGDQHKQGDNGIADSLEKIL